MAEFLVTRNFHQETAAKKCGFIAEALLRAQDGDVITLDLGEWSENIPLAKSVAIQGRGARDETVVHGEVRIIASNVTVRRLTITARGDTSTELLRRPPGIYVQNAENVAIADCFLAEWNPGVKLESVKNSRVYGCHVRHCQDYAVSLVECENCAVIGNDSDGNSWFGVRLQKSKNCRVEGNTIHEAGWVGIQVDKRSTDNTLKSNVIQATNLGIGMSSGHNLIESNRIEHCHHGIFIGDTPFDTEKEDWSKGKRAAGSDRTGNRIISNDIRDSKREAVLIREASETVVEGNSFVRSEFHDIVVVSDSTQKLGNNNSESPPPNQVADLSQGFRVDHQPGALLWGDTHMHTMMSDASGTVDEGLAYARDALGLDFVASADHSENVVEDKETDRWASIVESCKRFHEPGRFVAIPGFELTYPNPWWSHLNIYYAGFDGPIFSGMFFRKSALEARAFTPEDAIAKLTAIPTRSLIIRHHFMSAPAYWDRTPHAPQVIVGADVCSVHGIWEKDHDPFRNAPWTHPIGTIRQGLQRGLRFAVMAGSDTHFGLPGDYALTAVLADECTLDGIFDAIMARRTYATTGEKIGLEFTVNGHSMGASYYPEAPPVIRARVQGTAELDTVQVLRDNAVVFALPGGKDEVELEFKDEDWEQASFYYLRVVQKDGGQAWSTPVWLEKQ